MMRINSREQGCYQKIVYCIYLCFIVFVMFIAGCDSNKQNESQEGQAQTKLISETLNWSERMADSEIYRRGESLAYSASNPEVKWNYQTGLFLKSLLDLWTKTNEDKYFEFTQRVIDSFVDEIGNIKTYQIEDYNIDKINSGKVLLQLYKITGKNKYREAASTLKGQLNKHPRTKEGGFWHKKRYPWQMWLDGIYMGSPFYAQYSLLFEQPDGFDDVINQILLIDVQTRDPKTKLRYHGWDSSNKQKWANPTTGCSPNFWGRAMGWYAMALVDVLDFLPVKHQKRDQVIFILKDICTAIAAYQDQESGVWFQVLDQGGREGNYLEASASCMFVYTLAKATRLMYIDSKYLEVVKTGYEGILKKFVRVDPDGLVNLTQICSVAGLGGDPYRDGSYEYYLSEPLVENDLKGIGPFILASLQIELIPN